MGDLKVASGLGTRLYDARESCGMRRETMASRLNVSLRTVMRAEAEGYARRVLVMAWAMATGTDAHYLETGHPATEAVAGCLECARRDSNPQPSDMGSHVSLPAPLSRSAA